MIKDRALKYSQTCRVMDEVEAALAHPLFGDAVEELVAIYTKAFIIKIMCMP